MSHLGISDRLLALDSEAGTLNSDKKQFQRVAPVF